MAKMDNQIQLPRLYIYLRDFRQAHKFVAYILEKGLHDKKRTELRELTHQAFNTSLIISYSRPFGWNKEFQEKYKSSLRGYIGEVLLEDEVELHEQVIAMRNSTYAHSQASSHLIEGFDYSKYIPLMHIVMPLDKTAARKLKIMIEKWIRYLEAEKAKLKAQKHRAADSSLRQAV